MDEDEDLWDALDAGAGAGAVVASTPATATTPVPPAPPTMDDDQEMWNIMYELEQEKAKEAFTTPGYCRKERIMTAVMTPVHGQPVHAGGAQY
jgi:hypothetical protein